MISKYKTKLPIIIIIILAVIGTIGYMMNDSGNPIRVLFKTKGGPVIFTHKNHIEEYEGDCTNCHHNAKDKYGNDIWRCRDCHSAGGAIDSACKERPIHKQCIGANCIDCHLSNGLEANNCGFCHR